jgi:ferredoxin
MKEPTIDLGDCILCEICSEVAPQAFQMTGEGFIQVMPLEDYSDDQIHKAVINCPKDCISWE